MVLTKDTKYKALHIFLSFLFVVFAFFLLWKACIELKNIDTIKNTPGLPIVVDWMAWSFLGTGIVYFTIDLVKILKRNSATNVYPKDMKKLLREKEELENKIERIKEEISRKE